MWLDNSTGEYIPRKGAATCFQFLDAHTDLPAAGEDTHVIDPMYYGSRRRVVHVPKLIIPDPASAAVLVLQPKDVKILFTDTIIGCAFSLFEAFVEMSERLYWIFVYSGKNICILVMYELYHSFVDYQRDHPKKLYTISFVLGFAWAFLMLFDMEFCQYFNIDLDRC